CMEGGCMEGGCMEGGCMEGGCMEGGCMEGGCMEGGCMEGGDRRGHPRMNPSSEVHRKLRKIIPKLKIEGVGFEKVLQNLSDTSQTNIHAKWPVLKAAFVRKDSPVSVKLTNVTFGKALKSILESIESAQPPIPLGFVVDENVITISTKQDLDLAMCMAMQERVMVAERAFPRKQAEHMDVMIKLVQRMKQTCFDSEAVGVMAVGALKEEVPRKDEDIIKDLEGQLAQVKTLGLRNAIRLTLKDLYKHRGKNEKVIEHIKALIAENDKALQAQEKK
ncbi:MAG: hypothetical protein SVV80_00765, partial [Planctomycetota bacterium]|nr:hypothetical protein [Planctomycetota bacterium]